jgi:5'(3')-deoxyribonucleotidase
MRSACSPKSWRLLGSASRIRVGMDVDGTVAKTNHAIISEYNLLRGTDFTVNDYDRWDVQESSVKMSYEVYYLLYDKLWLDEPHKIAPAASPELMGELSTNFDLSLSTNRPERHRAALSEWFERHYAFVPGIDIVSSSADKLRKGYQVIFEDNPCFITEHAKIESPSKPLVFLVDAPWNHREDYSAHGNVVRVENLDAGIAALLRMRRSASRRKAPA